VTLFRGAGRAARRYLGSDRSTADEYYLEAGTVLAEFSVTNASGKLVAERSLDADEYAAWVNWTDPLTRTSMGIPREAGAGKRGSPRFAAVRRDGRERAEVSLDRCRSVPGGVRRT
jgi:hypothetical protein